METRHPALRRLDKIFAIEKLLTTMPNDHPNRKEMEDLLKELKEQDPVDI